MPGIGQTKRPGAGNARGVVVTLQQTNPRVKAILRSIHDFPKQLFHQFFLSNARRICFHTF